MRIRTQLILAAFLLAVVPLTAIVGWSYHSSRTALERAYRSEAARATRQMDQRLATIRHEIDDRLATVSALPLSAAAASQPQSAEAQDAVVRPIVAAMGDFADLIESVEFQPIHHARADAAHEQDRARTERREPPTVPAPEAPPAAAAVAEAGSHQVVVKMPPGTPAFPGPVIINIPPPSEVRKYVIAADQRERIRELATIAQKLKNDQLTPEERKATEAELERARREMEKQIRFDTASVEEAMERVRFQDEERQRQVMAATEAWRVQAKRNAVERRVVRRATPVPETPSAPEMTTPAAASVLRSAEIEKTPPVRQVERTPAVAPSAAEKSAAVKNKEKEQERTNHARKTSLLFGRPFNAQVKKEGSLVGQVTARVSADEVIRRVLSTSTDEGSEIPFAVDREGNLYTRNAAQRQTLERLGVARKIRAGIVPNDIAGWIVTASTDKPSGLRIGVARPVGENLEELRRAAAQNFSIGLGLIAFALIGIVPLANHLTRDVALVTRGAERIAQGDLMTRLPVRSNNEFGQLSLAFNRMAEDLSVQQQQLVAQERARQDQELHQRLLAAEYDRKTVELEDARRFQLSLLPKHVPEHQDYEVAVYTRTATEVGGDYYDFQITDEGVMSVAIGDATGHGAKAGTMVTVVKTLFTSYAASRQPHAFLSDAAEKIKRMELGRMSMSLSIARFERNRVTMASAGMPPVFVHRTSTSTVEEFSQHATPLGTIATAYDDVTIGLAAGDTILFMTDGFPELLNDAGQQLGYPAAMDAFAVAAAAPDVAAVIASLTAAAQAWHGDQAPNDDVTFVAVRVR